MYHSQHNCVDLDQDIQKRLLDTLSVILSGKPFNYPGTPSRKYTLKRPNERAEQLPLSKEEQVNTRV